MKKKMNKKRLGSSFRDPTGFLFTEEGILYRQINRIGFENYFAMIDSGLYKDLVDADLVISHEEASPFDRQSLPDQLIIKPEKIAFISYPYEWCFSQLKHAALCTLEIQQIALKHGMSLKDCSAYNIQFHHGKPVLIDTLSFEIYQEGEPWTAYRQFCQHFLAPLALMAYTDVRLGQLLRNYIDGIPLDLTSKLLPKKTKFSFPLYIHIHLHARSQKQYAEKENIVDQDSRRMQKHQLLGLIDSLKSSVDKLSWNAEQTDWAEYEKFHHYSPAALQHKTDLVSDFIVQTEVSSVWDLGANVGQFSRLASHMDISTIAFDVDPGAVELNYLRAIDDGDPNLLPLIADLTNPSPGLGWAHEERQSLVERGPADTVLALALIHHLAIGNNVPFSQLAGFFSRICSHLIIEFVPKGDPQVENLLRIRKDIFSDYNQEHFIQEFSAYFDILSQEAIIDTDRILFLLKNKH
jgi:hypothetical protein